MMSRRALHVRTGFPRLRRRSNSPGLKFCCCSRSSIQITMSCSMTLETMLMAHTSSHHEGEHSCVSVSFMMSTMDGPMPTSATTFGL